MIVILVVAQPYKTLNLIHATMDTKNETSNCVNRAGTTSSEGSAHGRCGVVDQAPAGRHQATDQTRKRLKWEKEVNRIVIECWVRSVPTKREYRQRMKRLWDEKEYLR